MARAQTTKREATSIKINPEIWKHAKIAAIEDGMGLSDLLEKLLNNYLKNRE